MTRQLIRFGAPTLGLIIIAVLASMRIMANTTHSIDAPHSTKGPDLKLIPASSVANSINTLSMALHQELRGKNDNFFFSAFSISSVLNVALTGASGQTAQEMRAALALPPDADKTASQFQSLLASLRRAPRKPDELTIVNGVWVQKGKSLSDPFVQGAKDNFDARIENTNFIAQPEPSRKLINDWVAQETHDKIQDLIPDGSISPDTRLVLVNAMYFKGTWSRSFDRVANADFLTRNGKTVQVPMMQVREYTLYAEDDHFQALQRPYLGDRLAMLILLPKNRDATQQMNTDSDVTLDQITALQSKLAEQRVEVRLPKWKTESTYELTEALQSLGMKLAFTPNADFSGIDQSHDFCISAIFHKTFINVDEAGTEAAAATGGTFEATSYNPEIPAVFNADHPFLYFIVDQTTHVILFAGRLGDPTR